MRTYNRKNVSPVYFPALDEEHLEVFNAVEELRLAVSGGAPADLVEIALRRLTEHVTAHFAHEERLMRASRYSGYAWHLQSHDAARKRVRRGGAEIDDQSANDRGKAGIGGNGDVIYISTNSGSSWTPCTMPRLRFGGMM